MRRTKTRDFRHLMEAAGHSPVTLAAASGVSVATIYRAIGGSEPRALLLQALAKALRASEARCRSAIAAAREAA